MAKSKRKQKLKVYRTAIGFHDAYVAAPSQKAALEAWGVDTNLFARDSAEEVTEPDLMKVPLEHPGQVVKVLRGTKAEQLAALAEQEPSAKTRKSRVKQSEVVRKRPDKRPPKPSRSTLDRAEKAVEALEKRQEQEVAAIEKEQKALEQKRRDLLRGHERERDEAREEVEAERAKYEKALRRHDSS